MSTAVSSADTVATVNCNLLGPNEDGSYTLQVVSGTPANSSFTIELGGSEIWIGQLRADDQG